MQKQGQFSPHFVSASPPKCPNLTSNKPASIKYCETWIFTWTHCDTIQQCTALYRSRDNFYHFSSVGMQDSHSAETPDQTNSYKHFWKDNCHMDGHTVIQYSSTVHHAEAGAISATFHQLFMSWTTDTQWLNPYSCMSLYMRWPLINFYTFSIFFREIVVRTRHPGRNTIS